MDTMKKNEMTILSAMEEIVELAKRYGLETVFYTQAADSLDYLSKKLGLSVEEAMLLAFFFEKSSSNRIWISSIADMINVSNIRIISMITTADSLVKKGYIRCNESNREEKYYKVPFEVINSIRLNKPVVPKPIANLSVDDFFDRLGELFDEEDVPFHDEHNFDFELPFDSQLFCDHLVEKFNWLKHQNGYVFGEDCYVVLPPKR